MVEVGLRGSRKEGASMSGTWYKMVRAVGTTVAHESLVIDTVVTTYFGRLREDVVRMLLR